MTLTKVTQLVHGEAGFLILSGVKVHDLITLPTPPALHPTYNVGDDGRIGGESPSPLRLTQISLIPSLGGSILENVKLKDNFNL